MNISVSMPSIEVTSQHQRWLMFLVLSTFVLCLPEPAFAGGGGGGIAGIGALIDRVSTFMRDTLGRGLAVLALILAGIGWKFNLYGLRDLGNIIIGVILVWGAPQIIDYIWT